MGAELHPGKKANVTGWIEGTEALMNGSSYSLIVADDEGEIVGFMDYILVEEPEMEVKLSFYRHWFIKQEYRGGLLAKNMWDYCVIHERGRGATRSQFLVDEKQLEMWLSRGCKVSQYLIEREV